MKDRGETVAVDVVVDVERREDPRSKAGRDGEKVVTGEGGKMAR